MTIVLNSFTQILGIVNGEHIVYDSRAATLEKLGRISDALKDARKVIDMCPDSYKVGRLALASRFLLTRGLSCSGLLPSRFAVSGDGTRRLRKEND